MPLYDRYNSWSQFLTGLLEKETAYGKAGARSAVQKTVQKQLIANTWQLNPQLI